VHADGGGSFFELRSNGLQTNRDAWNWNSSKPQLDGSTGLMISFFNDQVARFQEQFPNLTGSVKARSEKAKTWVDLDPSKFSWDRSDFRRVAKGETFKLSDVRVMNGTYRPFHRRFVNASRAMNKEASQLHRVYPDANTKNLTICVPMPGSSAPPLFGTHD
jgi:predicted helicase